MARRLRAGEMSSVVTVREHKIEAGSTAYDTFGQLSVSSTAWTTLITRRAKIEPLSGDEAVVARQLYPRATYRVTLDYDATLGSTGACRRAVVYNGRWLWIGTATRKQMQLELLCGEER